MGHPVAGTPRNVRKSFNLKIRKTFGIHFQNTKILPQKFGQSWQHWLLIHCLPSIMRLKFFMRKSWKGYCHSQLTDVEKVSIDKYKMDHCFGHCQNHCFPSSTCCFPFIAIQVMFVNGFILVFSISSCRKKHVAWNGTFFPSSPCLSGTALFMFYHF